MRGRFLGCLRSVDPWTWAVVCVLLALSLIEQRGLISAMASRAARSWRPAAHHLDFLVERSPSAADNGVLERAGVRAGTKRARAVGNPSGADLGHHAHPVARRLAGCRSQSHLCPDPALEWAQRLLALPDIGRRHDAAFVGALAVAFAPFHASQAPHVQMRALSGCRSRWSACIGIGKPVSGDGSPASPPAVVLNGLTCGYFLALFQRLLGVAISGSQLPRVI